MANKLITDLQLISSFGDTSNIAVQGDQTYRATGAQMFTWIRSKGVVSTYDSAITYAANAFVVYSGELYKSIQGTNTNNTPSSSPTYWTPFGDLYVEDSPLFSDNYALAASVSSNALTIALKDKSGADASATSPVKFAFRSDTLTAGTYSVVSVTSALSIVVPSTATLGHASGYTNSIYVYLLNNAGTAELLISSTPLDESTTHTSTTISTGATSITGKYSTTGRTSKAIRYLGTFTVTEATAGTWATAPTAVSTGVTPTAGPAMSDSEATRAGFFTYRHGTTYNNSAAPTITMPSRSPSGGGASITINRSSFRPWQDKAGTWFMEGRFNASIPSVGATTSVTFSVSGMTSENTADQVFSSAANNTTGSDRNIIGNNSSNFVITHSGSTTSNYSVWFCIELKEKPLFAW